MQDVTGPMSMTITQWAATVDPALYTLPASPIAIGQLRKALKKVYNYDRAGVMSVEQYLQLRKPTTKNVWAQEYSDKRVHLAYVKYAVPKMHYYIRWTDADPGYVEMAIPKTVYDALNLPVYPL
jgi:hypothetical protein